LGSGSAVAEPVRGGRAAVIVGSASHATQKQLLDFRRRHPIYDLSEDDIAEPDRAIARTIAWASARRNDAAIAISATTDLAVVRRNQTRYGVDEAGTRVESILSGIASGLVEDGVRRLVVAGGETSGAVVRRLGVAQLRIGPRIDVGVPWTIAQRVTPLGLALKSGNFGADDFFERAIAMTA